MGLCDDLELGEEEIDVHIRLIHFVVQHKITQHCKAIILQFLLNDGSY